MKFLYPFLSLGCVLMLVSPTQAQQSETIACPAVADISYIPEIDSQGLWLMSGQSGTYVFQGLIPMIQKVAPALTQRVSPTLKAEQIVGEGSFELTCSYKFQKKAYRNQKAALKITLNEYKNCKVINDKSFECEKF